ncbi:cytochrome P450 [Westerdykella ornata]|uniref:Cytochrome P450 n=1 Tax=Westerdykella ornata TaxID=318751 RepID=A0A6A6JUE0_WESOR|nr:cytochrome P450 [Westerdykella ornata]KAF2280231.1 cytochrome P450 [Westerdykella ornata]
MFSIRVWEVRGWGAATFRTVLAYVFDPCGYSPSSPTYFPNTLPLATDRAKIGKLHLCDATRVCWAIGLGIYRLFFHPLAKFPGPKLAAATRLYEAYYDVAKNGQYTFKIAQLHSKYGPIVRISPHELHINDPSFYEKLYRQDGRWDKYSWSYDAFSAPYSSICTADHELHKRRRAAVSPFFSRAQVSKRQHIIKAAVDKLCARISEYADSGFAMNLGTAISALTGDVATVYIVGKSYNNLDRQDFNMAMTNVLRSSGAIWRVTKHIRWLGPTLKALPMSFIEKCGDDGARAFLAFLKEVTQITKDNISSHVSKELDASEDRTLIHCISRSHLPLKEKSFDRINDEVSTIMGAALETTAQTLRVILYYIYTDKEILHKLRAELSSASLTQADGLYLRELEQLPYLTAVLMEGLRLSPGLATRMARIAPDRSIYYEQWKIPAGTPVGMTTLLIHTDERAYSQPKRFDPERWMDPNARKKADKTFAPFSRGTRICLGMHLAWAELYMTTAALVQRFDFVLEGAGPKDVECVSDQFIIGTEDQSGIKAFVSEHEAQR